MPELNQILRQRSSIRAYTSEALTAGEISALIDAALMAPTARNARELFVTAVSTADPVVAAIQKALNPNAGTSFYYDAPELFFISGDDSFKWTTLDAGIAVENMHLAAQDMGLGSVIIGCIDGCMQGEGAAEFSKALHIPEGYSFRIALAVGHPAAGKIPHSYDTAAQSIILN